MDNQEKSATMGKQDKDKQNKNTTQYMLYTTMRKQTQITMKQKYNCKFTKRDSYVLYVLYINLNRYRSLSCDYNSISENTTITISLLLY
jgi:hypothetical protein